MKIMILGKNGQLGADLEKIARDKGHDVFSYGHEDLDIQNDEALAVEIDKNKPGF